VLVLGEQHPDHVMRVPVRMSRVIGDDRSTGRSRRSAEL
jgi:hypothetical protein